MSNTPVPVATRTQLAERLRLIRQIVAARSVGEILEQLPSLTETLQRAHFISVALFEDRRGEDWVRMLVAHATELEGPGDDFLKSSFIQKSATHGFRAADTAAGEVRKHGDALYFPDLLDETRYPSVFSAYRAASLRSMLYLPLRTGRTFPAVLVCGSKEPHAFSPGLTESLSELTAFIALALENNIAIEEVREAQRVAELERSRLQVLLRIAHAMAAELEVDTIRNTLMRELFKYVRHRFGSVSEYDAELDVLRVVHVDDVDVEMARQMGDSIPMRQTASGAAYLEGRTVLFRLGIDDDKYPYSAAMVRRCKSDWMCALPLSTRSSTLGVLNVGGQMADIPSPSDLAFLGQLADHLALAMERSRVLGEIRAQNEDLERKTLALEHEIGDELNFDEIVGRSSALRAVLAKVDAVARTDATVLIQGESGTGKELIARAIHNRSSRNGKPFVKISCAAIPSGLLESELFGHEKGAFTGATSMRQGRFELAHQGTILLDEIAELPSELQAKLLRVLQEREFERVGSGVTRQADVRVLAATNRDLKAMTSTGGFREDLYYRLSTFPITVPPVRERHGDIQLLVRFFVQQISRKLGRSVNKIPEFVMRAMQRYSWPGNVRELQNFIERAVILSKGNTLNPPIGELDEIHVSSSSSSGTMEEAERKIIIRALEECQWVVGGPRGAAAKLGLKRTTLQSRILKLGVRRIDSSDN